MININKYDNNKLLELYDCMIIFLFYNIEFFLINEDFICKPSSFNKTKKIINEMNKNYDIFEKLYEKFEYFNEFRNNLIFPIKYLIFPKKYVVDYFEYNEKILYNNFDIIIDSNIEMFYDFITNIPKNKFNNLKFNEKDNLHMLNYNSKIYIPFEILDLEYEREPYSESESEPEFEQEQEQEENTGLSIFFNEKIYDKDNLVFNEDYLRNEYVNPTELEKQYHVQRDIIEIEDDEHIIDGICGIEYINNLVVYDRRINIIFIYDTHKLSGTYLNYNNIFYSMQTYLNIDDYDSYFEFLNDRFNEHEYRDNYETIDTFINNLLRNNCVDLFVEYEFEKDKKNTTSFLELIHLGLLKCNYKTKYYDKKICNKYYPSIRYHLSDIRSYEILSKLTDKYYKMVYNNMDDKSFKDLKDEYYDMVHKFLFYIFSFEENNDFIHLYINENDIEVINYFRNIKKLIKKQFRKSIFKKNIDTYKLIEIIENMEKENPSFISGIIPSKIILNGILILSMNLYSIFRMFVDDWDIEKHNPNEYCKNYRFPKNIIYYAGGNHNIWIKNFIYLIFIDKTDLKIDSYNILSNNNYIRLNNYNYNNFIKLFK